MFASHEVEDNILFRKKFYITYTGIRLALRPYISNPAGYYPQFYKTRDRV